MNKNHQYHPYQTLLQKSKLFKGLSERELLAICQLANLMQVGPGEYFFHQDAPSTRMYVLLEGQVKLSQLGFDGQQVLIRMVSPCEDFGAVATISATPYPLTAEAVEPSLAAAWDKATLFDTILQEFPRVTCNALELVTLRFGQLQQRYRELATERVEQRIARTLLRLAEKSGRKIDDSIFINLTLSRQDLAAMTGTTLYSVSRILNKWERQGLVEIGRVHVTIRNQAGLTSIAEDLPLKSYPKPPP